MDLHQSSAGAIAEEHAAGELEVEVEAEVEAERKGTGIARRLAWSIWVLSVGLLTAGLLIAYAGDPNSFGSNLVVNLFAVPTIIAFATVGALIASRRPENPIGWVFCGSALLILLGDFAEQYARYAVLQKPGSLPGGMAMAWLATWPLQVGFFLMFTVLLLLFPDGRLPSRRWR